MSKPNITCPMCGIPVKVVGKTTLHYEPILPSKQEIADIITSSSLWNLGEDSHNALSELVEVIVDYIESGKGDKG